jgi:hypothetical protein
LNNGKTVLKWVHMKLSIDWIHTELKRCDGVLIPLHVYEGGVRKNRTPPGVSI